MMIVYMKKLLILVSILLAFDVSAEPLDVLTNRLEQLRGRLLQWANARNGKTPPAFRKRKTATVASMDRLAVIVCGKKAGTGFILRDGGRSYLFTNAHVVEEGHVLAKLLNGAMLKLGPCDIASGRDLARFELAGPLPSFELEQDMPNIGEAVTVFGNSDGRGVITELHGRVLGIGPEEIEISAPFVTGNSGSPVLNRAGRVVGVATYLRDCRSTTDWSKVDTRFNGIRRFAIRLTGIRWVRSRVVKGN